MDNRDVLERAETALENIADWENRHGKGINLVPIITDLVAEVERLRNLDRITTVLYEHRWYQNRDHPAFGRCACDWLGDGGLEVN